MDIACPYCGAKAWSQERTGGSAAKPRFSMCCKDGVVRLAYADPPPEVLKELLKDTSSDAGKEFHKNARFYNNALSMATTGVKWEDHHPGSLYIRGKTYHCIARNMKPARGRKRRNAEVLALDPERAVMEMCNIEPKAIGHRVILPSSHAGSPRNMHHRYQDAMAVVRRLRRPSLFITFTRNGRRSRASCFRAMTRRTAPTCARACSTSSCARSCVTWCSARCWGASSAARTSSTLPHGNYSITGEVSEHGKRAVHAMVTRHSHVLSYRIRLAAVGKRLPTLLSLPPRHRDALGFGRYERTLTLPTLPAHAAQRPAARRASGRTRRTRRRKAARAAAAACADV
jgi:hypothetical protein